VFEEMRDARLAESLVGAADLVGDQLRDDRRPRRRQDDDLQAIAEGKGLGRTTLDCQQVGQRRGRRCGQRAKAAEQNPPARERSAGQKMPSSRPR
jgi:hypothetical protein